MAPQTNRLTSDNDNALFRNDGKPELFPSLNLPTNNGDGDGESDVDTDILQPLLPPQINYDKVNKYAPFSNESSDFFNTFYFHPSFGNIFLLFCLFIFTLWVIVMNLLTVIGLWRTHRKGHVADLYLVNLAIGDTLLGILILPLMDVVILLGYFPFTRVVCDVWVFLDYYLIIAASFGSCAMMATYLWMMKWPDTFPVDSKYHLTAIAFSWIAVNISWTPSFFNDRISTYYPQGQCGFSVSRNQYFSLYVGITGFYIPLLISVICGIWSRVGLKGTSAGIPILSWKQSLSIGRRKRSSRLVNEVIWTFFKLMPDSIIDSLDNPDAKKTIKAAAKRPPKFFGPGAANEAQMQEIFTIPRKGKKPPKLMDIKRQQSLTNNKKKDPKLIAQMAIDHYPLVVSSLLLFIGCRSLFYIYFGGGVFILNFFPLDLSNGVYWLMHSNAALSPLIHFAFDPELREEVMDMLGIHFNPQRTLKVNPVVNIASITPDIKMRNKNLGELRNSTNFMSKESNVSNWSHFSAESCHLQPIVSAETSPEVVKKVVLLDKVVSDEDSAKRKLKLEDRDPNIANSDVNGIAVTK